MKTTKTETHLSTLQILEAVRDALAANLQRQQRALAESSAHGASAEMAEYAARSRQVCDGIGY